MERTLRRIGVGSLFAVVTPPVFAATTDAFRNEKVIVTEEALALGEQERSPGHMRASWRSQRRRSRAKSADGTVKNRAVQARHDQRAGRALTVKNSDTCRCGCARGALTAGSDETWGTTGLPPNDKVLVEDQHSRTYEIRIAAHAVEPQHTHHARVVVCLNGAQLEHVLPDGTRQPSTLKTDEVTWRLGQTHTGHNLGDTDLWVIAIEPK